MEYGGNGMDQMCGNKAENSPFYSETPGSQKATRIYGIKSTWKLNNRRKNK